MAKIVLDIPDYTSEKGLLLGWENNFSISCHVNNDEVVISANQQGLISLAKQLLALAQSNVPNGHHYHLDELNSLESGSRELIITKIDA